MQEVLLWALLHRDLVSGGHGAPHDLDGAEVNIQSVKLVGKSLNNIKQNKQETSERRPPQPFPPPQC